MKNNLLNTENLFDTLIPKRLNIDEILENYKFNDKDVFIGFKKKQKIFIKSSIINARSKNELNLLKKINKFNNVNIIELIDSLIVDDYVYLVLSYYSMNLYEYINIECIPLKFDLIINITNQLKNVICFLHSNNICHGDLKLENILLDNKDNNQIKLIDFEYTREYAKMDATISDRNGTIYYNSPEMISRYEYDPFKAELWAVGICIYTLSEYKYPYNYNKYNKKYNLKLLESEISFVSTDQKLIPLLNALMNRNPDKRTFI